MVKTIQGRAFSFYINMEMYTLAQMKMLDSPMWVVEHFALDLGNKVTLPERESPPCGFRGPGGHGRSIHRSLPGSPTIDRR